MLHLKAHAIFHVTLLIKLITAWSTFDLVHAHICLHTIGWPMSARTISPHLSGSSMEEIKMLQGSV